MLHCIHREEPETVQTGWEDPEEAAVSLTVNLAVPTGEVNAVLDTGAKSVWVDEEWFLEQGGVVQPSGINAESADGSAMDIAGIGTFPWFHLWGRRFKNESVNVLRNLPSKMLMGAKFWRTNNLVLDSSTLNGKIRLDGKTSAGPVRLREAVEKVRATAESVTDAEADIRAVEVSIKTMDLDSFSDSTRQVEELRELLWGFRTLFSGHGCVKDVEHRIELKPGAAPACVPVRRRSPAQEDAEKREATKLLERGVVEPTISPWAAANVFVPKKSGELRTTTDFRLLNSMTVTDTYPMECVRETLDWLAGREVFSTFDLKDGFFQVPLAQESRPLTAVRTVMGLFQYCRLPQGLKNSPATFQRIVNTVLGDMKGQSVSGFVDDILVGIGTAESHLIELRKVLTRVQDSGMKLKLSKCKFGCRSVEVLGHAVTLGGIVQPKGHGDAIKNLREPSNGAELLRFLGHANYFSDFIENFANRSEALYKVLTGSGFNKKKRKGVKVSIPDFDRKWTRRQLDAWQDLKGDLSAPRMLVAPERQSMKRLMTDASSYGLGAVLLQQGTDLTWRPIAFGARKPKGAEIRYTVTEQECLAVVFALRRWRHYFQGGPNFEIVTDHIALKWLMSLRDPRGRLARSVVEVQDFDFTVNHAPGSSLTVPDCLSSDAIERETAEVFCSRCKETVMGVRELASLPSISAFKEAQEDAYGPATDFMRSNEEYIVDDDGLLCRDTNEGARVLVPEPLRKDVLEYFHGAPTTGHYGVPRTCRKVKDRFWWPGVRACVSAFVSECLTCEMYRASKPLRQGNVQVYHPRRRFEIIALDVLEISPKSRAGTIKVVVIGDTFTRFVWAYPVKDERAETIASVLLDGWILRYGTPEKLLSDRGKAFAGRLLARICEKVGVKKNIHDRISSANRRVCGETE